MAIVNPVNFLAAPGASPFPQTITDPNGPGIPPTAVVFILSGHKASQGALGTPVARGRLSIGFWKSDGTQMAVAGSLKDAGIASVGISDWRSDNAKVATIPTGQTAAGTLGASFTVASAAANSITGDWNSTGPDEYGIAFFIYGALVEASVEVKTSDGTIGNSVSSAALGKLPDLLIAASCGQAVGAAAGGQELMLSVGVMARHSATQGCVSVCNEHAQSNTSAGNMIRDDAILSEITSAAGTVTETARVEAALTSTGFTLTTRGFNKALAGIYIALYLGGVRCWVGVEEIAASTTGSKSVTTPGWKPRTVGAIAPTAGSGVQNTVLSTNGRLSIGLATAQAQGVAGMWGRDNQGTVETDSVASQSDLIAIPSAAATLDWLANLTAMTATGFDINVSDAAATARLALFFAIEGQYPDGRGAQAQPAVAPGPAPGPARIVPAGHRSSGPGAGHGAVTGAAPGAPASSSSAPFGVAAAPPSSAGSPVGAAPAAVGSEGAAVAPASAPTGGATPPVAPTGSHTVAAGASGVTPSAHAHQQQAAGLGGRIFQGMGAIYRALQRWRIEAFYAFHGRTAVEKATEAEVPLFVPVRTANQRGHNAVAGSESGDDSGAASSPLGWNAIAYSEAGDNALAGSGRGA